VYERCHLASQPIRRLRRLPTYTVDPTSATMSPLSPPDPSEELAEEGNRRFKIITSLIIYSFWSFGPSLRTTLAAPMSRTGRHVIMSSSSSWMRWKVIKEDCLELWKAVIALVESLRSTEMGCIFSCIGGVFRCIGDAIMNLIAMIAGCLECMIGSIAGFIATVVDCLTCGCFRSRY